MQITHRDRFDNFDDKYTLWDRTGRSCNQGRAGVSWQLLVTEAEAGRAGLYYSKRWPSCKTVEQAWPLDLGVVCVGTRTFLPASRHESASRSFSNSTLGAAHAEGSRQVVPLHESHEFVAVQNVTFYSRPSAAVSGRAPLTS